MVNVAVTARGKVGAREKRHARERIAGLDARVRYPVLGARVALTHEPNPRLERPARAEAELNVNGNMLRGRVAGVSMKQAIDELGTHLERQLQDFGDRRARLTRRVRQPAEGEWHHAAWSPPRPSYYPRPAQERSIVRRKTFALDELDTMQAVVEMLDLDHDFFLFRDAQSRADAVVYRREDGRIGLIFPAGVRARLPVEEGLVHEPSRAPEPLTLEAAVSEMDALNHRFMFFIDAATSRGNVIYMRYDGHYGLIQPAD